MGNFAIWFYCNHSDSLNVFFFLYNSTWHLQNVTSAGINSELINRIFLCPYARYPVRFMSYMRTRKKERLVSNLMDPTDPVILDGQIMFWKLPDQRHKCKGIHPSIPAPCSSLMFSALFHQPHAQATTCKLLLSTKHQVLHKREN